MISNFITVLTKMWMDGGEGGGGGEQTPDVSLRISVHFSNRIFIL